MGSATSVWRDVLKVLAGCWDIGGDGCVAEPVNMCCWDSNTVKDALLGAVGSLGWEAVGGLVLAGAGGEQEMGEGKRREERARRTHKGNEGDRDVEES